MFCFKCLINKLDHRRDGKIFFYNQNANEPGALNKAAEITNTMETSITTGKYIQIATSKGSYEEIKDKLQEVGYF